MEKEQCSFLKGRSIGIFVGVGGFMEQHICLIAEYVLWLEFHYSELIGNGSIFDVLQLDIFALHYEMVLCILLFADDI